MGHAVPVHEGTGEALRGGVLGGYSIHVLRKERAEGRRLVLRKECREVGASQSA
jgi:hypothetical protein